MNLLLIFFVNVVTLACNYVDLDLVGVATFWDASGLDGSKMGQAICLACKSMSLGAGGESQALL